MLKKITRIRNPWLIFSPFLFYYGYIIFINKWPKLYGDEVRYVDFAKNLLHGFYSPPMPHINLWNGPGYPILLMPFVALHIPDLYTTLMNAVWYYLAVVLLYKAITLVANRKIALVCSLLLAIYPNTASMLPILYTEDFTAFLVSAFIYCVTLSYAKGKAKYAVLAGLALAYLILTKIIFGYVVILGLATCLTGLLFKKKRFYSLRSIKILAIAFAISVPYLIYTWHLTGKVFYWGNSGGMSLYWMSTPYEHEFGDWKVPELSNKQYPTLFKSSPEVIGLLKKNHAKEVKFILTHNEVQQDELFKQKAIENIKKSPLKFIKNYYYNFSRMLFNFPYSYSYQDGAIVENILIGSLILWGTVICIIVTIVNRRSIIFPVKMLLSLTGIYLALSGALSAYPRQLDVIVPVLLFWAAYLKFNTGRLNLKFTVAEQLEDIELTDLAEIGVYTETSDIENDCK